MQDHLRKGQKNPQVCAPLLTFSGIFSLVFFYLLKNFALSHFHNNNNAAWQHDIKFKLLQEFRLRDITRKHEIRIIFFIVFFGICCKVTPIQVQVKNAVCLCNMTSVQTQMTLFYISIIYIAHLYLLETGPQPNSSSMRMAEHMYC